MRIVYVPYVSFEIPLPWDVLHAATIKYLPGRVRGWVEFAPQILAPGLSVFTLTQYQLGNLGRIELLKSGDKMTCVDVECPAWSNPDQLDGPRKEHLEEVVQFYLSNLVHAESIWEANSTFPPLYVLKLAGIKSAEDGFRESRYFGDFIKAAFNKAQAVSGDASEGQATKPWELIPDHNWDRTAVEMWYNGSTNNEIAKVVNVSGRSVTNRIVELRRNYRNAVEKNEERRRRFIQKRQNS